MREELAPGVVRGEFWTRTRNDRVRCELCPRYCTLGHGQRGFCFVRQARSDAGIVLTSYGRSTGFCLDPIEKKPLHHFLPGSGILSFGTAGCNLGCRFCQNWHISKAAESERLGEWAYPEEIAQAAVRTGCAAVAFTYNDPVISLEYVCDTAAACRAQGIKTVAVTAGYITAAARSRFFQFIDAANIDLKSFSEGFYRRLCGAHLEPVLETLLYVKHQTNVWLEVTTLLIPGHNDSADEVARLVDWILTHLGPDVPLHFSAFHPAFKLQTTERTPLSTLQRAREQAQQAGLHYVYIGNIADAEAQNTWCAQCGELLIERRGYQLGVWNVRDATCTFCGHRVAGHFASKPGPYSGGCQPIFLHCRPHF